MPFFLYEISFFVLSPLNAGSKEIFKKKRERKNMAIIFGPF